MAVGPIRHLPDVRNQLAAGAVVICVAGEFRGRVHPEQLGGSEAAGAA
jgi:hypothetical protein